MGKPVLSLAIATALWMVGTYGLLGIQVQAGQPEGASLRPNVLFIAVDDLRCDLGSLGSTHAQSPHLDAFAKTARLFSHHYVQVPTCGASRCSLWRGQYPSVRAQVSNGGILSTQATWADRSLPALFRRHGYRALALGKLTHHPGGLTGRDWAEGPEELPGAWDRAWIPDGPWKSPEAIMHGYANGYARKPGKSAPWEAHDGPDAAYPDAWVADEAIATLQQLASQEQPWFFGVGFFKPHLPFAAPKIWHDLHAKNTFDLDPAIAAKPSWPSGWHGSGEFRGNYGHEGRDPANDLEYARLMRQAYAACVSYVDAQAGRVLDALRKLDLEKNTIVVVWSDHGFLLGEHGIWGKHCLYEPALRTPLLIRNPGLPEPGAICNALVETVDLFPTLMELCHLPSPPGLDGKSLLPQLLNSGAGTAKPAYSFWTDGQRTVRTDRWRLIIKQEKGIASREELFDYQSDPDETKNVASDHPEVVQQLLLHLERVPQPTGQKG
jgi:iduronate 2-sulfatase